MSLVAIIGGSGLYNLEKVKLLEKIAIDTPFGMPSSEVLRLEVDGCEFLFLPRHGEGHSISPSEVNYRANIYALKVLGARVVLSISAVGSLKDEHEPTKFVLPSQFIDWTKGLRKRTFFESGVVGHVSTAYPVNFDLQKRIADSLEEIDANHSVGGSYLCIEGPQFSSRAESELYRSFGADVIGMTNVPESYLAKEAGMAYATVAMITDYDCWKEKHCTVEEIMKVMGGNVLTAQKLIEKVIPSLVKNPIEFESENKYAIVTRDDLISAEQKTINEKLLG